MKKSIIFKKKKKTFFLLSFLHCEVIYYFLDNKIKIKYLYANGITILLFVYFYNKYGFVYSITFRQNKL